MPDSHLRMKIERLLSTERVSFFLDSFTEGPHILAAPPLLKVGR